MYYKSLIDKQQMQSLLTPAITFKNENRPVNLSELYKTERS